MVTGVSPVTGAVTPSIVESVITAADVAGNTAVTIPELIIFVTGVASATVKKSAATPVKV